MLTQQLHHLLLLIRLVAVRDGIVAWAASVARSSVRSATLLLMPLYEVLSVSEGEQLPGVENRPRADDAKR